MARYIDLNADMGESFGPWVMGNDEKLLEIITSANIACGFHAGDWDVMARTMQLALANGVRIGCHPGFPDLQGFGRQPMQFSHESLKNIIRYQLGASIAMARSVGGEVQHFKLHGAMGNMTSVDEEMARACYEAALEIAPDLEIIVIAGTAQQRAVEALGANWAGEIFADRAYNDDATLVNRKLPGAVIHDPDYAAERMVNMVKSNAIITETGQKIPAKIDTICMHGDTPEALEIARAVRKKLIEANVEIGST